MNPQLILTGTCYDFANVDSGLDQAHPDFNYFGCGVSPGMVEQELGADNKPVLAGNGNGCVTSVDTFNQWFNSVPGVNIVIPDIQLVAYWDEESKAYKYRNDAFFPIDNQGYGNENKGRNFGFCFELHTRFTYDPSQVFEFMGDDDVWVYINGNLAIDLGGVHGASSASVSLNTLGLTEGLVYPLDFFFCERHVVESHLIFSTSIMLDPCGTVDSDSDGSPDLCDPCPHGDQVIKVTKDDQVSSQNSVTFHMSATMPQTGALTVTVDFGDGSGEEQYDVATSDMAFTHVYGKSGDYTATFTGSSLTGCGSWTSTMDISCEGKRIAPKCSEIPLQPGSQAGPSRRRRSL